MSQKDKSLVYHLQSLSLYESFRGDYTITVGFSSKGGKVELTLNADLGRKIVEMCFEEIIGAIHQASAESMKAMAEAHQKMVEASLPPIIIPSIEQSDDTNPSDGDMDDELPF